MANNKFKFTKTTIDNIKPDIKMKRYYDTEASGLCMVVTNNNHKSYYLYKKINGEPVSIKIGNVNDITPQKARDIAAELKEAIRLGKNPKQEKRKYKEGTKLKDLYSDYIFEKSNSLKETTIIWYESIWNNKLSKLGNEKVSDIDGELLKDYYKYLVKNCGIYSANAVFKLLRAIYNHAIRDDKYEGKNPTQSVRLNATPSRIRSLSDPEMANLLKVLNNYENSTITDIIFVLLFTGARKNNVLSMRWRHIDFDKKVWTIPETKTDKNVTLALADAVIDILKERKDDAINDWVFPSPTSKSGHITDIKKSWKNILNMAKIDDFRIHDLRHTFATYLVENGAGTFEVKRALNHKSIKSTEIYVNLGVEHLRNQINEVANNTLNMGRIKK